MRFSGWTGAQFWDLASQNSGSLSLGFRVLGFVQRLSEVL